MSLSNQGAKEGLMESSPTAHSLSPPPKPIQDCVPGHQPEEARPFLHRVPFQK